MSRFSATLLNHAREPRNQGLLDPADALGVGGRPGSGPFLVLSLRLSENRITCARHQSHGCGVTIACGSMLTTLVIGRTLAECRQITAETLIAALEGVPPDKLLAPAAAIEALERALEVVGREG